MKWSAQLLAISRPLMFVLVLSLYIIDPQVSRTGTAIYAVAMAFFIASSTIIVDWVSVAPHLRHTALWLELILVPVLYVYTCLSYNSDAIFVLMMVVIVSIPMALERKHWRTAFLALILPWAAFMGMTWKPGVTLMEMAMYGGANLFFGATGVLITSLREEQARSKRLLREVTTSQAALERAHRQLQASAATQQQVAVLEERQRLAREIHDSVAHGLTALVVQTQAARRLMERDPSRALEVVAKCEEMARDALQETRRAVRALHPAGLEQQNDVEAIRRLARDYGAATDMQIQVLADGASLALLPDAARLEQLYRIAQEALTNAHRHGHAQTAAIELSVADHALHMVIRNDGAPPENLDPGVGLRSMQERSHSIGGECTYEVTEFGMTIRVTVPLKQEVAG